MPHNCKLAQLQVVQSEHAFNYSHTLQVVLDVLRLEALKASTRNLLFSWPGCSRLPIVKSTSPDRSCYELYWNAYHTAIQR